MKTKEEPLTPDFPSRDTEPFRVPDGYFEGLTNRILSALPDPPADAPQPPTVSLMEKVKPLIYLAAAFLGMGITTTTDEDTPTTPYPHVHPHGAHTIRGAKG